MTVEVRLSYKGIAAGVKVQEYEAITEKEEIRRRCSVEFENPLWPFGVASFKVSHPDGKVSIDPWIHITKASHSDGDPYYTYNQGLPPGRESEWILAYL